MKFFNLIIIFCVLTSNCVYADSKVDTLTIVIDDAIADMYNFLKNKQNNTNIKNRITLISENLLGSRYQLTALGEGYYGRYDQFPLYRIDAFDCETFVDMVLALAFATDVDSFKQCIKKIRYKDGKVSYINRNHFLSLDWNNNNQKQNYIRDITKNIKDKDNKEVAVYATALINKPKWYSHFNIEKIRLVKNHPKLHENRLKELKKKGQTLEKTYSTIAYIPLTKLFDENGKAREHLFKQIPHASIVEIIRPNWNLKKKIGTCLNASHLGFAIWKNDTLYFREASSIHNKVVDVPLIDYLKKARTSPTIKGINIQDVIVTKPLGENCEVDG